MTTSGYRFFRVAKPAWWKRYVIEAHMRSGRIYPLTKSWSWDRADDLAEKLNDIVAEEVGDLSA